MEESLELIPLFSGSSGNSILVRANGLNLLFDIGLTCKRVSDALTSVGTSPDEIDAVFISHSHSDHIKGVDVFMRKYSVPVYATEATLGALNRISTKPHSPEQEILINDKDRIELNNGVEVVVCPTPHDCRGSVCYRVEAGSRSAVIMTDLGHITEDIDNFSEGADIALIESNYDLDMLLYGPYDYVLKRRVGGPNGHLSNDDCAKMMASMISKGTGMFFLGHLSENNNTPLKAAETITSYLESLGLKKDLDYRFRIAGRYEPTEGLSV